MKIGTKVIVVLSVVLLATTLISAAKKPKQKIDMLDWKGSAMNQQIPEWVQKAPCQQYGYSKLA